MLKQGGREEVVLENAALLDVTEEGVTVSALFEQPKLIRDAAVGNIDFLKNEVTLIKTSRKAAHGSEDND